MKLEPADFPDVVLDALADRLAERLRSVLAPAQAPDRYVSRSEAVAMGIERRAPLAAEKSGALRCYRPGKATVYREHELLAFIEATCVPADVPKVAPVVELPSDPFERARAQARVRARAR